MIAQRSYKEVCMKRETFGETPDSMLPLVDSHCHLDGAQFDPDRDDVLARAREAGVQAIVVPGIDLQHCRQALALARRAKDVFAAVGIHPNDSDGCTAEALQEVRALAQEPEVVAYGEIGLDYHWNKVSPTQQQRAFEEQLELAAALGLPVIIHSRESNDDVAAILCAWVESRQFQRSPLAQRAYAGVLHAFSGDRALAEQAYSWNFVLSLGGPVTFKNARQLQTLVPQLDPDRLMIETDAPYLAPHPYRGKRNEPAHVALVCRQLAALYDITPTEMAQRSSKLASAFFGLVLGQPQATDGQRP